MTCQGCLTEAQERKVPKHRFYSLSQLEAVALACKPLWTAAFDVLATQVHKNHPEKARFGEALLRRYNAGEPPHVISTGLRGEFAGSLLTGEGVTDWVRRTISYWVYDATLGNDVLFASWYTASGCVYVGRSYSSPRTAHAVCQVVAEAGSLSVLCVQYPLYGAYEEFMSKTRSAADRFRSSQAV